MSAVLEWLKTFLMLYFFPTLILYLVPKKSYQKYLQFAVKMILLAVVFLPLLNRVSGGVDFFSLVEEFETYKAESGLTDMEGLGRDCRMDTSKKGADIIRNIMGNRNNLLILALLGVLVLVLAIPTEKKTESKMDFKTNEEAGGEQLEERLERILKHTEGVGEARVMITRGRGYKKFCIG